MQALSAGIAITLLLSGPGQTQAQTRNAITPKAVVSPAATPKVAPRVLPANAIQPAKSTTEQHAYSDLVEHVAKTLDDFADDNTTEDQGRDHLDDLPADASTDDADGKAPVATKTGKRP